MFNYLCIIFYSVFFLMTIMVSSPLSMVSLFLFSTIISSYFLYVNFNEFFVFLLFLVYVGGMLVMLIYSTMISGNYILDVSKSALVKVSIFLSTLSASISYFWSFDLVFSSKSFLENASALYNYSSLAMAGFFLFFVFLQVCNLIFLGGRSVGIGNT
uniref:NADH dehydrogenase subunit 6 n=1 Tax=Monacha cartusiana TaxID=225461 RepID=UPI0023D858C1|nr:NADH dehydrogenase subunit 6 [Monacha cartusiana]URP31095.1 NADH dehydrogenase subunit 6 [Monacha cartusiana]